jgi:hypothetical protein
MNAQHGIKKNRASREPKNHQPTRRKIAGKTPPKKGEKTATGIPRRALHEGAAG